jgi:hypothetical protein
MELALMGNCTDWSQSALRGVVGQYGVPARGAMPGGIVEMPPTVQVGDCIVNGAMVICTICQNANGSGGGVVTSRGCDAGVFRACVGVAWRPPIETLLMSIRFSACTYGSRPYRHRVGCFN